MSLSKFFDNTKRVFLVAKKPDYKEYMDLAKVTGIGIAILGVLGFIILLIIRTIYMP